MDECLSNIELVKERADICRAGYEVYTKHSLLIVSLLLLTILVMLAFMIRNHRNKMKLVNATIVKRITIPKHKK